jgi:hypothetical protein
MNPSVSSEMLVWLCSDTPLVNSRVAAGCFQLLVIFELGFVFRCIALPPQFSESAQSMTGASERTMTVATIEAEFFGEFPLRYVELHGMNGTL